MTETTDQDLKGQIRDHYAERAVAATEGRSCSCCCGGAVEPQDELARGLYDVAETGDLPAEAVLASLGCGNPTALADLQPGEVVLDLGSGGGIDVLLSARRVGPTGKAYGLDMTDEMLALARENQEKAGLTNVEFLKGEIETIPLPDESVDVVISNCVINLSTDKDRVLAEAFRVLRPGGRFAVSDVVFQGDMDLVPDALLRDVEAWSAASPAHSRSATTSPGWSAPGSPTPPWRSPPSTTARPRTRAAARRPCRTACSSSAASSAPSSRPLTDARSRNLEESWTASPASITSAAGAATRP